MQSLDLLRRWTDLGAFYSHYSPRAVHIDTMEHRLADDTLLETTAMIGEPGDPDWAHSIHRADLFGTLQRALPAGRLHPGRETESVTPDAGGARITFVDGTRVRARVVIAADGIRSVVRHRLFSQDEPVLSGMINCRAVLPAAVLGDLSNDRLRTWLLEGTAFMLLPVRGGDEVAFDAVVYTDTPWTEY